MFKYIAHDTETTLIGKDNIIPDIICSSFFELGGNDFEVVPWSPKEAHVGILRTLLSDESVHLIYHNAAFDLAVIAKYDWALLPLIWAALDAGRIHDTMIREMLNNLTTYGSIDKISDDVAKLRVGYSLADLVLKYLKIDIAAEKDAEDSVRTNYEMVMYKPIEEWPKEYIEYAGMDAKYTGLSFLEQAESGRTTFETTGYDPFIKESAVISTALALQFMTAQGNALDTERVTQVTKEFLDLYTDESLVWPLVHSKYIQQVRKTSLVPIPESKLIQRAHASWDQMNEKGKKYWKNTGIIIPASPGKPFKNGAKNHAVTCEGHPENPDYVRGKNIKFCMCPIKTTQPTPEKGSDINLHQYIWDAAKTNPDIECWLSEGMKDKFKHAGMDVPHPVPADMLQDNAEIPFISFEEGAKPTRLSLCVNREWLATYGALDPVLDVYNERHKIQKIVSSYLPCLYWAEGYKTACPIIMEGATDKFSKKIPAERVHAAFAPLKETGRVSSYASKKGRGSNLTVTYPSWNGQQVDPRIRQCVIPSEGNALFSIDYSAMELGTAAQTAFDLLGYEGVLMTLINSHKDTHTYLGAQIAVALDPEFTRAWGLSADDPMKSYDLLKAVAKDDTRCDSPIFNDIFETCYLGKKWGDHEVTWEDCTMRQYYKHFRTFGKPTGLGFWGGLGEATFISMAKASYGIQVGMDVAKILRQIWRTYIPEGQQYLDYVNKYMVDPLAEEIVEETADGKMKKKRFYCYDTPLGMHRAKCSFTAAANGRALQSPSAEGALDSVVEIMKKCTVGELAGYVFPSIAIHDELFGEIIMDEHTTERIQLMQTIMKTSMEKITPKVRASTEASLMLRWDKRAEPVFDEAGNLVPWVPAD